MLIKLMLSTAECSGSKSFTSADALITNPDVEAVVITTPDQTHAELTLACLEAYKPVLCEKPTRHQCREC
ncbi:TPA: hypothetical protein EYG59_23150 [Candidatus Poribacteria bacterium]|nr:hypothetical protein [Candidatus Poribacteria bacterium]